MNETVALSSKSRNQITKYNAIDWFYSFGIGVLFVKFFDTVYCTNGRFGIETDGAYLYTQTLI